jgi:hypothetical protein
MDIKMDFNLGLNIFFGLATLISLFYAVKSKAAEKRFRDLYQTHCRNKCKTLTGTARDLTHNALKSCSYIHKCEEFTNSNSKQCPYVTRLTGYIYSIRTSANSLIDFCKNMSEEYTREFKEPIYENFKSELDVILCESEEHSNINQHNQTNSVDAKTRAAG